MKVSSRDKLARKKVRLPMPPALLHPPPLFPIDDSEDGASLLRLNSTSKELEPQYTAFVQSYRLAHKWKSPLMKFKGLAKPHKDYKCPHLDAEFLKRFNREVSVQTIIPSTGRNISTAIKDTSPPPTSTTSMTPTSKRISTTVTTTTLPPTTATTTTTKMMTTTVTQPTTTSTKLVKTTPKSISSPPFELNATNSSLEVISERVNINHFFRTETFDFNSNNNNNQSNDLVSSASSIANINSTFLVFNFLLVPVAIILVTLFLFMLAIIPIRCRGSKQKLKSKKTSSFSAYYGLPTMTTSTSSLDRNSSGLISAYLNATPSSTLLVDSTTRRNKYELIENLRSQIMAASEEYNSYLNASTLQKMSSKRRDLRTNSSYASLNHDTARYGLCELNPQPNIGSISSNIRKFNDYDLEAASGQQRHLSSESPPKSNEYYHSSNLIFNNTEQLLYSTPLNDLNKPNLRQQSSSLVRPSEKTADSQHYLSSAMFANTNHDYYPQMNYLSTFGRSCMNQNKTKSALIPASLMAPQPLEPASPLLAKPAPLGDNIGQRPAFEAELLSCQNCLKRNVSDLIDHPPGQQFNANTLNSDHHHHHHPYTISETLDQADIYARPGAAARIFPRTNPKCRNVKARNSLVGLSCSDYFNHQPEPSRHSWSSVDLDNLPVYCSKL